MSGFSRTFGSVRLAPDRQMMDPVTGRITEQLPAGLYRVKLDAGSMVTVHIADRLDRNFIRLLVGDRVRVELSPADAGRGRVVEKIL